MKNAKVIELLNEILRNCRADVFEGEVEHPSIYATEALNKNKEYVEALEIAIDVFKKAK